MAQRNGTGMFPREVVLKPHRVRLQPNAFPLLPLEEEGRLNDMPLRENFLERILPVAEGATGPTAESLAFRLAVCRGQTARPHGPRC
jgi:hypothetical protein